MKIFRALPRLGIFWIGVCAAMIGLPAILLVSAPHLARAQNSQTSQEAVVAPNENLVVENIPPIPQSLADQADRYTNFRSAFFASWHPTKREMLVATRFADTFQIHQVKMPAGARTQLTFYVDDVRSALYPPTGRGLHRLFPGHGRRRILPTLPLRCCLRQNHAADRRQSRNTDARWAHSGKQLVYTSTRRNGKDDDLYVMDPAQNPKTDRLVAPGGKAAAGNRSTGPLTIQTDGSRGIHFRQ